MVISLSHYVNLQGRSVLGRPSWGVSSKKARAMRYVNSFNQNVKIIYALNNLNDNAKQGV